MNVKEEREKVGLKRNIQETKIMASGSINLWQTDGENVEAVTDFLSLGSKITEEGNLVMKSEDACFLAGKL